MTIIILHRGALRVTSMGSFLCQQLAGCHTSAESILNGAINNGALQSPQDGCLPKCLKKLFSWPRARGKIPKTCHLDWRQQKLRVTAVELEQISDSWNRNKGSKGTITHIHSISGCTSRPKSIGKFFPAQTICGIGAGMKRSQTRPKGQFLVSKITTTCFKLPFP